MGKKDGAQVGEFESRVPSFLSLAHGNNTPGRVRCEYGGIANWLIRSRTFVFARLFSFSCISRITAFSANNYAFKLRFALMRSTTHVQIFEPNPFWIADEKIERVCRRKVSVVRCFVRSRDTISFGSHDASHSHGYYSIILISLYRKRSRVYGTFLTGGIRLALVIYFIAGRLYSIQKCSVWIRKTNRIYFPSSEAHFVGYFSSWIPTLRYITTVHFVTFIIIFELNSNFVEIIF